MDSYSSLFTSGLMALCETQPRSRPASHQSKDSVSGLRSFLSLEMAESLRTLTHSASPTSSRSNSLMPERRIRTVSSSGPAKSALMTRRRSLPEPKPAPLAELPVLPTIHSRCNSESASPTAPAFDIAPAEPEPKELAVPSSLKLELSSAPTTPGSRFPTTPTSSRAMSMLSPTTTSDAPWLPSVDPTSPDAWVDSFLASLSPTTQQSIAQPQPIEHSLGLQLPPHIPNIDALLEEHIPAPVAPTVPKMARARRPDRRNVPSRNTSVNSSMRSSQASVSTSYRRVQRGGALAKLEGREPRSQWMSDEEDSNASTKYGLSLMPSMEFKSRSFVGVPENVKHQLVPFTTEDLNSSFIDLTDDIVSRRGLSSFAS